MDLCVAGLPICVESADKEFFHKRYEAYRREDDREPVMRMRTQVMDSLTVPQGEFVERIKNVQVVRLPDGRLCRYLCRNGADTPAFVISWTPDYAQVEILLSASQPHPQLSLQDLEYVYTGIMFHNRFSTLGGCSLHSSALAWRGQGIAFSAPSGTGKSTHTGLWKERFGDDVVIVNDDKPMLRFEEDGVYMYGSPWSGKTALNVNCRVPLRAIVFLERGESNTVRPMEPVEAMLSLSTQIARPYYDAALGERLVDITGQLLTALPIYQLTCSISQKAVDAVFDAIFAQGDVNI